MSGYDEPWRQGGLREDGYWQMDPRAFRGPPAPAWHEPGRSGYSTVDPRDMREPNQGYGMEQNQVPTISPEDSAWLQEMIDSKDQGVWINPNISPKELEAFKRDYQEYQGSNPLEAIRRQSGVAASDLESQRALQQLNTMQPAAKMPQKPATNTDEFLRMRSGGR